MLSAGVRRVSFIVLALMSCPCVGLGPVRTSFQEIGAGSFPLLVRLGFWVLFSP